MTFLNEPTTVDHFEPAVKRGRSVLTGAGKIPSSFNQDYINGYMNVLRAEGVEPIPVVNVHKVPGPFTSWITQDCFEQYASEMIALFRAAGPVDGVLLALHGALAVSGVPKPEAELCRRVREAVGKVPVMVTLDLHANEDHELTDATDAVFILKTYPHVDSEEIGEIAARCMVATVRGQMRPTQALRRPGIVSASIFQGTRDEPMKGLYERCRKWERHQGVYCVSIAPGFAYADVPDIGMCVIAVTDNDQALADLVAEDVSAAAWELRDSFFRQLPNPKEAVAKAMELVAKGEGPVVLADGADRIGDSTHVLRELIAQGARNWAEAGIYDPAAAAELERTAKVGDHVTLRIGGWYGVHSGEPVEITGTVAYMGRPRYTLVGPMGKGRTVQDGFVARVDLGDSRHVMVADRTRVANDSSPLEAVGVDVASLDIIPLKNRAHHRAFWDTVAKVNMPLDAPGYREVPDLSQLEYENVPADIYPIGRKWRERV
jgi:microcystin degradation protein MlrC